MSNEALTAVSKAEIRPSGRKFVLMALADYADEAWSCFPSVDQLAAYTSQGEKTVRDHLDALDEAGIISRDRHRREDGTLGRYRFVINRRNLPVADQRRDSPEAKFARGEKHPKPPADFAAHNPQENPQESSLRSDKRTPRQELETVLDAERAGDVIEHRQRLRKPLTAKAAKLLAKQLAQCPDPNVAADLMIERGWLAVKPDWVANADRARGSPAKSERVDHFKEFSERMNGQAGNSAGEFGDWTDAQGIPILTIEHQR